MPRSGLIRFVEPHRLIEKHSGRVQDAEVDNKFRHALVANGRDDRGSTNARWKLSARRPVRDVVDRSPHTRFLHGHKVTSKMPTPRISRAARIAIVSRLSNVTTGFTPNLVSRLADAGITPPIGWKLPISYDAGSFNFFQGDLSAQDLDNTSTITYPAQTLFSTGAVNNNREKFHMFAGTCVFGLNTMCSWKSGKALPDFETVMDCVEEALFITFNSQNNQAWATDDQLSYNGDLSLQRTKLSKGAENFYQAMIGRLTIDVYTD